MFSWFVDNATLIYFLLGLVALVLVALWWMNRKRHLLIALGVVAGLAAIVVCLSMTIVTERARIRTAILAMRAGVLEGKPDAVFKHFSKDFKTDFQDRKRFVEAAGPAIRAHRVDDIVLWDFDFESPPKREDKALIAFRARVRATDGESMFLVRAEFVFEDGDWRMKSIRLFNFFANTDTQIPMPLP
jgi:hypothetical protein